MNFELLNERHLDLLLRFEVENRGWFESLIASRGSEFYSREAVLSHITQCLSLYKRGALLPFVVVESQQVIARANLKNICLQSMVAEVGYRVAERYQGQGVGTYCLAELIRWSISKYGQLSLKAEVLENNPGSRRILEKHGFRDVSFEPGFTTINGTLLGCTTMERAACA